MVGAEMVIKSILRIIDGVKSHIPKGLIRFLAIGIVGLTIQTSVFSLFFNSGFNKSAAWLAGFVLATVGTWSLNRRFTFARTGRRLRVETFRYLVVTIAAQTTSFTIFQVTYGLFPKIPAPVDVIFGAAFAAGFSYTGQRFFTFGALKKEISSNVDR